MSADKQAANITTRDLAYSDLDTPLTGMLCRDEAQLGTRPGILLVHGGAGLDDHAREQARRYAALGYVVLACAMFGDGIAGDRNRGIGCLTALRDDPVLLVRRAQAGLTALADCPGTDGRFAAVGFCFGGMAVLALARSGERLAGAVSIHGSLTTAARRNRAASRPGCSSVTGPWTRTSPSTTSPPLLEMALLARLAASHAAHLHGLTHRHAQPGVTPGVAYNPLADDRSFSAARTFLAELFEERHGSSSGRRSGH